MVASLRPINTPPLRTNGRVFLLQQSDVTFNLLRSVSDQKVAGEIYGTRMWQVHYNLLPQCQFIQQFKKKLIKQHNSPRHVKSELCHWTCDCLSSLEECDHRLTVGTVGL